MLTQQEIRKLFNVHFNYQKNIMTPNIIKYEQRGKYIIEISKGTFSNQLIYGFTVLEINKYNSTNRPEDTDFSECLYSINEVENNLNKLEALTK